QPVCLDSPTIFPNPRDALFLAPFLPEYKRPLVFSGFAQQAGHRTKPRNESNVIAHAPTMKRLLQHWRLLVVTVLLVSPVIVLHALGSYHFWWSGMGVWLWWPLTGCFVLAMFLAWRWQKARRLLHPVDFTAPLHWTDRDRTAWKLVE